jgi:hypothetical protein
MKQKILLKQRCSKCNKKIRRDTEYYHSGKRLCSVKCFNKMKYADMIKPNSKTYVIEHNNYPQTTKSALKLENASPRASNNQNQVIFTEDDIL